MLDCLVIGGGPAGLLAAVYLGRYRRSVQVIDAGESRAAKIPESHNYPGFFGIAGPELLRRLNAQARQYGAEMVRGRVTSLRKEGETFVASSSGSDVNARFILFATGLVDHCPPIEGQPADCPSEAIRFCPICDGYEAIDRRVGVLGDLKVGAKKALFLRTYTKDVSLFLTDGTSEEAGLREELTKANVRIVERLNQIRQATENTVSPLLRNTEKAMKWTLSTLHSVASFAPISPLGWEPLRPKMATSKLMTTSGRPSTVFMRQGTSLRTYIN